MMFYKLIVSNSVDGLTQTSWTLVLPTTIGRNPEHGVSINHESISRTHCRLSLNTAGALSIRDSNSTNGTYVGDRKIKQSVLLPGDVLQVGAISFRVEYDSEAETNERMATPMTHDLSRTVPMQAIRKPGADRVAPNPWWRFW